MVKHCELFIGRSWIEPELVSDSGSIEALSGWDWESFPWGSLLAEAFFPPGIWWVEYQEKEASSSGESLGI